MAGWIQNNRLTSRQLSLSGAACAAGLLIFAAGCGGGGDDRAGFGNSDGSVSGTADLTGTWDLTGLAASGKSISCPSASNPNTVQNILTVNNVEADRCIAGENIAFSGNNYTITYPAPRFINLTVESGTYSVGGGSITLSRNSQGFDTNNDGIISASETTSVSPEQKLTASLRVQNNVLTLVPQSSDSSNDIRRTVEGAAVESTFTKRAQ